MSEACRICLRRPGAVNNVVSECSHVDCPHRRVGWVDLEDDLKLHYIAASSEVSPLDMLFDRQENE